MSPGLMWRSGGEGTLGDGNCSHSRPLGQDSGGARLRGGRSRDSVAGFRTPAPSSQVCGWGSCPGLLLCELRWEPVTPPATALFPAAGGFADRGGVKALMSRSRRSQKYIHPPPRCSTVAPLQTLPLLLNTQSVAFLRATLGLSSRSAGTTWVSAHESPKAWFFLVTWNPLSPKMRCEF